ncbi:MAG: hypothetical protein HFI88_03890 [Lachnospiraceae bacterium]|nr:hypothetical protein [Lachnospiraceae bacterium]
MEKKKGFYQKIVAFFTEYAFCLWKTGLLPFGAGLCSSRGVLDLLRLRSND